MEVKHICKYCGAKTTNSMEVCTNCDKKIPLIRQIRAMLMPYYISKKAREKMLAGSDGNPENGGLRSEQKC